MNYSFKSVNQLIIEDGGLARLGAIVFDRFGHSRVMIVTDSGLVKLGLVTKAEAALAEAGHVVSIYDGVEPDPAETIIIEAGARAREYKASVIIGLGGGSSIDVAKLASVLANGDQPISAMYGLGNITGERLPLIQIPTTSGSGSEVTSVAVVTIGADKKMGVGSPVLTADIALLDAELTLGLPKNISAYTAIDAMVHAIEAYTSKIKKNPVSDMYAREALGHIGLNFKTICDDPSNIKARRHVLLGACLAGAAFDNAPVAAVHALAYPIGAIHHVPHGLSNALMLPHVLRFNMPVAERLYAELAESIGLEASGEALVTWLCDLIQYSGLPMQLRDVGIDQSGLARLAADSQLQTRLLINNPVEVTAADAIKLYEAAW